MVKIKYVGHWQPVEIKDVEEKKAKALVETGQWEYVNKIEVMEPIAKEEEEASNGDGKRIKKRSSKRF